ncbi:protein asteroid-like, partial [Ceratina calcarata]
MGIPGLTTYIHDHSDRYLRNYELHDTYLVIDGINISCRMFKLYMDARCNSAFGGDYDSYARAVSIFFDDLLKCRITPLVLIDGANEDKQLRKSIVRRKERMQSASRFSLSGQHRTEIFPLLQVDVFRSVMIKKNIRHAQCLFEADNEIAAVAKILNCPVLSYDSDFYIYGSQYIPFNTLDTCVVSHSRGKGYVKRCKIYKAEYLLNSFRGLHESMLPLAAILLGNDYVERGTFTNFFRHMDIKKIPGRKYRESMITATFTWLSKYTLNTAITRILITLPEPSRRSMLNLIEDIINNYIKTSAEILIPLRFPTDYITRVKTQHLSRSFKFDGDISISTCIKQAYEGEKDEVRMEEDY